MQKIKFFKNNYFSLLLILILFVLNISAIAQDKIKKESISIEETVGNFLEIWLINHDIDTTLKFFSKNPALPKCWAAKEEGLEWRKTREGVIRIIQPFFKKVSEDVGEIKNLSEVIKNSKEKFRYGSLRPHKYSPQFDLYFVDAKLKNRLINDNKYGECENPEGGNSKFVAQRIKKQKELYLVYFYFKPSDLLTMIWIKEKREFRLFSIDFLI